MHITRLLALASASVLLSACSQDDNLLKLLANASVPRGAAAITKSCTSFLGLGPAVATFEISPELAKEAASLAGGFSEGSAWSHHDSMPEFVKERSRKVVGISATLLDGKDCLQGLTPSARAILFEKMPGTYYASPAEDVVIVLFAEPQGSGVIFVQSP